MLLTFLNFTNYICSLRSSLLNTFLGVLFTTDTDVIVGSTTVANTNVNTATNSGTTTSLSIITDSGFLFVTDVDLLIGSTAIAKTNLNTATHYQSYDQLGQSIDYTISSVLPQNEWTLSITSQAITKSVGVTVTQGSGATLVTGTLKTALTGASTSVVVSVASGVIFASGVELNVDGAIVVLGNVVTASGTSSDASNMIDGNNQRMEWTLTIASESVIASVGAVVKQGIVAGVLKTALNGATTSVVITSDSEIEFLNSGK